MNNIQVRPPYSNELYHHGVKGQKWGVRKYQNPDGSLTPEGKKRYNKSYAKKIDDAIERRQKVDESTDRALSAISSKSINNLMKTIGGMYVSTLGSGIIGSGAAQAGLALGSAGLLSAGVVAPLVGSGVALGVMGKGIYNAVQLHNAKKYYAGS